MGQDGQSISHSIDITTPSVARMYDWLLGGTDNYPSDQKACEELLEIVPSTRELAVNNRAFLVRAVDMLARRYNIRQFIDHGSGLPTQNNVHQVAQAVDRRSRVVYIDNDPIVLAHGRMLLDENDETAVIQAEMTETDRIFADPEVTRLIDPQEPTAVLFNSVLHCIPDSAEPGELVRRVADRLPAGSFILICQLVSADPQIRHDVTEFMRESTGDRWGRVREESDVQGFFEGFDIITPPGLTEVSRWFPDSEVTVRQKTFEWIEYGGVAAIPRP